MIYRLYDMVMYGCLYTFNVYKSIGGRSRPILGQVVHHHEFPSWTQIDQT